MWLSICLLQYLPPPTTPPFAITDFERPCICLGPQYRDGPYYSLLPKHLHIKFALDMGKFKYFGLFYSKLRSSSTILIAKNNPTGHKWPPKSTPGEDRGYIPLNPPVYIYFTSPCILPCGMFINHAIWDVHCIHSTSPYNLPLGMYILHKSYTLPLGCIDSSSPASLNLGCYYLNKE